MTLSVITAFFNEEENLPSYRERLTRVLDGLDCETEIVLVDDHSLDSGPQVVKAWIAEDPRVCYLRLSRNCGSNTAVSAGLAACRGDYAVVLPADLQDPPEMIPRLLNEAISGFDVVWAARAVRARESRVSRFFAGVYHQFLRRMTQPQMPAMGVDAVLIGRKVIDAYNALEEKHTGVVATILWMGFRQAFIEYVKEPRRAGESKWTLGKKVKLFIDSVVSFSYLPIRLMSLLGLLMLTSGFLYLLIFAVGRLGGWITSEIGFAALLTILLAGQGSILLMLGILGEYVWRSFDEARRRPRYIVEEFLRSDTSVSATTNASE